MLVPVFCIITIQSNAESEQFNDVALSFTQIFHSIQFIDMLLSHDISTWFSVQFIVQLSYIHIFHPLIVHSFTAFVQSKFPQLYAHRYQFVVQLTVGTVMFISSFAHVFAENLPTSVQFFLIVRTQSFMFQLNASSCPFVAKPVKSQISHVFQSRLQM